MADRFPLILNTSANQIQEIASGDSLDLTGNNIANAGIITAGNVTIGAATTDLVVTGDARITGILTIGTSSLKLDGPNNLVNVGTALTLGHTQGLQFHTQNLHSAGFEVNQINASGIITATQADINGDLDVDGHTNLDNVSVAGVTTFSNDVTFTGTNYTGAIWDKSEDHLKLNDNTRLRLGSGLNDFNARHDGTYTWLQNAAGPLLIDCSSSYLALISGNNLAGGKMAKFTHNGSAELYWDNSKKLETTNTGINVTGNVVGDGLTIDGDSDLNGDLDVDGHTNLDNVSIAGVVTASHLDYMTSKNIRIGENAGDSFSGTDANENILIGYNAGTAIDVCDKNVAIGVSALESVTGVKQGCVAIGYEAAKSYNNDGLSTGPVAIGFQALRAGGKGVQVAVGYRALTDCNSTGYWNVATGSDSLRQVTSGKMNVAHGTSTLSDITTAEKNTAIGHQAGKTLYSGNNNIMIGYHAYASGSNVSNEITLGNSLNTKLRVPGLGLIFSTSGNTIAGDTTFSSGITGTTATFSGNVSIGGTLTYEDVTNIDSVGIITARNGINVSSGTATISGTTDVLNVTHTGGNCAKFNRGGKTVSINANYAAGNSFSDIGLTSGMDLKFSLGGTHKIVFKSAGHIEPQTDSQINLGSNSVRFANAYVDTYYGDGSNLTGISVGGSSGIDFNDNVQVRFGTGNDAQLLHTGGQFRILNDTGDFYIKGAAAGNGDMFIEAKSGTTNARFFANSGATFYFAGNERIRVDTLGINVGTSHLAIGATVETNGQATFTGIVTASSFKLSDGSNVGGVDSDAQGNTVGGTNAGGNFNTSGNIPEGNTLFGKNAGDEITYSLWSTAVGYDALKKGSYNTAVGYQALMNNTGDTGNTAIGVQALRSCTTGSAMVAVGYGALYSTTSGAEMNVAVGNGAMQSLTTGDFSVALGNSANYGSTTASNNTAIGYQSLFVSNSGNNTALGYWAGRAVTGTDNTLIGTQSGMSGSNNLTSGSNNTLIGHDAAASSATVSNEVTIGDANVNKFRVPGLGFTVSSTAALVTGGLGVGLSPVFDSNHSSTYAIQASAAGQCLIAAFRTQDGVSASSNGMIMGLDGNYHYLIGRENRPLQFGANGNTLLELMTNGNLRPTSDNNYDLGSSSRRWRNIYTGDLNLSNKGSKNEVDGTWGNYTIQEGESDLFLINKRNGKKYKFNLTEVS